MRLFAGIDGGQSGTQAVVADESGRILARGSAGPADEVGESADSTKLHDALSGALGDALERAGLARDTQLDTVVAGISGYLGAFRGVSPTIAASRFVPMHDAPIAHAGALAGGPGAIVIAGTGSVAYAAHDASSGTMYGGWGYLFGDEGSAFWIVKTAIAIAARHEPCSGSDRMCAYFDVSTLRDLVQAFYRDEISRERLASFAKECIAAVREDPRVCDCVRNPVLDAALELVSLARKSTTQTPDLPSPARVSFVGGLMRDEWFRSLVGEAAREVGEVVDPAFDPAVGALILAYRHAGVPVTEIYGA